VDPTAATFEYVSYRQSKRYLAEHGPGDDRPDGHPYNKSEFFREPLPPLRPDRSRLGQREEREVALHRLPVTVDLEFSRTQRVV
jgi:hypothetical protein